MGILNKLALGAQQIDLNVKRLFRDLLENTTIAAAGSLISDGTLITANKVLVTAANGTKAVVLPPAIKDTVVEVVNTVSNAALIVFPNVATDQINAITAGASFSQAAGSNAKYHCDADGHWYVAAANLTGVATSATQLQLDQAAIPASGVEVVTATNVIAATESGMTYFLNSATEFVSTLPAPAAGLEFEFIVKAAPSGASYTIVTNAAAEIIVGHQFCSADAAGDAETTAGATTVTFVDGQAVIGDRLRVKSDGALWYASLFTAVAAGGTFTG